MRLANKSALREYFIKPLTQTQMNRLNHVNNIVFEKCHLFEDIIITLTTYIFDTYLGDDVMTTVDDQINHFTWCWNKTINNFEKENIYFSKTGKNYDYFVQYYLNVFYPHPNKNKMLLTVMIDFWQKLFSAEAKSQLRYDVFNEVYQIWNNALINKKKK